MKKKIFLISLMVMLFVCLLAMSASAAIVKHDTDPGLDCDESAVSTLDYAAFNNSTATDKESRVVLTDGSYYYVFPAYYVFSTTSTNFSPTLANLNAAIKAADATITSDLFTSSKTSFVRIQLPTWITDIQQGSKLEGWTVIKEFRFGTTLRTITAQNAFTNCSNLEYISDISHMTSINRATFTNCSSLKIHINWPAAVTSISSEMFSNTGITSITIPEGITYIGDTAFKNCDELTEITLPNTVTMIAKGAFSNCEKLKTVNLGASFKSFVSGNNDFETFQNSSAIKYVYLPNTGIKFQKSVWNNDIQKTEYFDNLRGYNIFSAGTNVTFFFTGDEEDAQKLKDTFIASGGNGVIEGATLVKYDPSVDYETYAQTLGKNIIVYDYNVCKAFYNDVHAYEEGTSLSVDSYVQSFDELCKCTVCKEAQKVNEFAPIFDFLGYSAEIDGDQICIGYSFNSESLTAYERITGKSISFGVVGIVPPSDANLEAFEPVNNDLTPYNEYTILTAVTREYASFDFVIRGFSADYYDLALTMCAFVSNGESVDYIASKNGATAQSEYAETITFNGVL